MTISASTINLLRLCWRRRWALFFLALAAALFAAPYLYWARILMPVALAAAHDAPLLLGLNTLAALGGLPLLMLAALGAGGSFSAWRKVLAGTDRTLMRELGRSIAASAKTSLLAGAVLGVSAGMAQVGLVNLHALLPGGVVRCLLAGLLFAQLLAAIPCCVLTLTQPDELQKHPLRAFSCAMQTLRKRPLGCVLCSAVTFLPPLLFFSWQTPLLTFLGFLYTELLGFGIGLVFWQQVSRKPKQDSKKNAPALAIAGGVFAAANLTALLVPLLRHFPSQAVQTGMRKTMEFIARQFRLEADNGTFRELLSSSSVWPLLLATLLGCACCITAAFVCACYRFRLRGLVFAMVVLLQILPMLSRYAALEQLLNNLHLRITPLILGLVWAALYLLLALLLYRRFHQLLPKLEKRREQFPGVRLFFYYALPRARHLVLPLTALVTLGYWNDAVAPFWYTRTLGSFSTLGYIWNRMALSERAAYPLLVLGLAGLGLLGLWVRKAKTRMKITSTT